MTQRFHRAPFGAEPDGSGTAFRLYAPDAARVELLIDGRAPISMEDAGAGWKSVHVIGVGDGDRYAYRLPDGLVFPDPASRFQPDGVTGRSQVVDPRRHEWTDDDWRGRPWEEAVIYETHVGAATPEGSFAALADRLEELAELGVTALELMPLAQWRGARNWGYDGVLPFAPANVYGAPEDLKRLIERAHGLGLMVIVDVVYNHFGPSGNYLNSYARSFFTDRRQTPWGDAINFDDCGCDATRSFFLHNALYWVEEFNVDGLRLDAVHAIHDDSERHILQEIAEEVRAHTTGRHVHLVLENDHNEARWLERDEDGLTPRLYTAQWNDDAHHCWHTLLTGERDGYYADFAEGAPGKLARSLAEGFVYQGDPSPFRDGEARGERSSHLHPAAFVDFLQNHDQVGNRAFGERIDAMSEGRRVSVARAALILSPHIPMLFMGEEWRELNPFLYFVDFNEEEELARAVREGRRREFEGFREFAGAGLEIPDPNAPATYLRSRLDRARAARGEHAQALARVRKLLALRRAKVTPLISSRFLGATASSDPRTALVDVTWRFEAGALRIILNLGGSDAAIGPCGETIHASEGVKATTGGANLPPWSILVSTDGTGD